MGKLPEDHDPDVIGVCTECHSEARAQYLYTHPLGGNAPCKICGGVLMIVHRDNLKNALMKKDHERGL